MNDAAVDPCAVASKPRRRKGPLRRAFKAVSRALALRAVPLLAFALFLLARTWRVRIVGYGAVVAEHEQGRNVIFAFGHGRMLPFVWSHRGRGVSVLISEHFDGELITRVIECFRLRAARGSATRGGARAIRELVLSARGADLAVTPDGPRGPFLSVKPGLPFLAARTGSAVIAASWDADRRIQLRSWDRFRVPLPGAKVVVIAKPPRRIPEDASEERLEAERAAIEADLSAAEEESGKIARRSRRDLARDLDMARPASSDVIVRSSEGPCEPTLVRGSSSVKRR
ncbi:lysophospholipid acyltransferase family protein [bacterium]|nr:lysophospholipid acyltransferase family protein [bacterium]